MEEYSTLFAPAEEEFTVHRSRFIGYAAPVSTPQEASALIAARRERFWDSSHTVYAYLLKEGQQRYSDDGEPQGTGGVPVLDVLQKTRLLDVLITVNRYFGGVLLGAGGLVRAYSHAASLAVSSARRKTVSACTELLLCCPYELYGKISFLLPQCRACTLESRFEEMVELRVLLRDCDLPSFQREVTERTGARVKPQVLQQRWACLEQSEES